MLLFSPSLSLSLLPQVSGKGEASPADLDISPNIYSCYYDNCLPPEEVPPPGERPDDFKRWSDPAAWESGRLPVDGEDVTIPASESAKSETGSSLMIRAGHLDPRRAFLKDRVISAVEKAPGRMAPGSMSLVSNLRPCCRLLSDPLGVKLMLTASRLTARPQHPGGE